MNKDINTYKENQKVLQYDEPDNTIRLQNGLVPSSDVARVKHNKKGALFME